MKKIGILLLVSALIAVSYFLFRQNTVKTVETAFNKEYFLTSDTTKGSLSLDFLIELPSDFKRNDVLDTIRHVIISNLFGSEYVSITNDTIIQTYANDLYKQYKMDNEPLLSKLENGSDYSFINEHRIEGFSLLADKHIFSYGIDRYGFMGGAHGLNTRNYYNFDLSTGKVINERDIFKNDSLLALTKIIKKNILDDAKKNQDPNSELIMSFEDTGYWTDSIKPNGNFYITDEGINYVFNPYEIAPYYIGQTEVVLTFDEVKDLLKPESIISYLIEKQAK